MACTDIEAAETTNARRKLCYLTTQLTLGERMQVSWLGCRIARSRIEIDVDPKPKPSAVRPILLQLAHEGKLVSQAKAAGLDTGCMPSYSQIMRYVWPCHSNRLRGGRARGGC